MEEINLFDYIRALMLRRWIIIIVTVVTVLLAGVIVTMMPKVYESTSTILFPSQGAGGDLSSKLAQLPIMIDIPSFSGRDVYVSVLKSRTLTENVRKRVGLDRYGVKVLVLQNSISCQATKEGGLLLTCDTPTSWLKPYVPKSELKQRTAKLAAEIVNTYIDELRTYDNSNALFLGRKNRVFIERQLVTTKRELSLAEDRLEQFQQKNPTLVPPDKSSTYAEQALGIATKQTEAQVALHEAERQLASVQATWKAGAPRGVSPDALIDNPVLGSLRSQLAQLEVKRATLLENFTESYPEVVSATQEIEKTNSKMRSEAAHVVAGKVANVNPTHQEVLRQLVLSEIARDSMKARATALAGAKADVERVASNLPPKEMQYARLLRDVRVVDVVYATLRQEHARAGIEEGRDKDGFIVLDSAIAPEKPSKPKIKLTLAAAMVVGLMLGIAIATAQGMPSSEQMK